MLPAPARARPLNITIAAVGRLRKGPELSLVEDYLERTRVIGRGLGIGSVVVHEVDERKAQDSASQGKKLEAAIPAQALSIALDERGKLMKSTEFADQIRKWRDNGSPGLVFLIGGADGIDPELRNRVDMKLSLGPMVWPHMLARAMLSEQLYRAISIIAGTPYHRA